MLLLFSFVIILVVAVAQYRNGLFTSAMMLIQVVIAGLIAFGYWEPIADELDAFWPDSRLAGYEDCLVLTALFCLSLLGMRLVTNRINKAMIDFNWVVQQIGGPALGVVTGYLLTGFLVCVLQTLPLEENFLGFTPRKTDEAGLRSYIPADRVWLALMRHAGAYALSWNEDHPEADNALERCVTFDRDGTYELRYLRYRRHTERRQPMRYEGELQKELGRSK